MKERCTLHLSFLCTIGLVQVSSLERWQPFGLLRLQKKKAQGVPGPVEAGCMLTLFISDFDIRTNPLVTFQLVCIPLNLNRTTSNAFLTHKQLRTQTSRIPTGTVRRLGPSFSHTYCQFPRLGYNSKTFSLPNVTFPAHSNVPFSPVLLPQPRHSSPVRMNAPSN